MEQILLIGAGGHARSCIDVIEQEGRYTIAGLTGLPAEVGAKVLGYPVLGTDDELPRLLREFSKALIGVGQIESPANRVRLYCLLEKYGCTLPIIASPRACVSRHAALGAGTIVMHGAIVNAGARIGRNCIVNSQALVEHDAKIDDHCHISTAAAINGSASVGAGCFVGSHACVREGIEVGDNCVIGMGQRVLVSCASGTRIPARKRNK